LTRKTISWYETTKKKRGSGQTAAKNCTKMWLGKQRGAREAHLEVWYFAVSNKVMGMGIKGKHPRKKEEGTGQK